MNAIDPQRIARLARACGVSPRQLVLAAVRIGTDGTGSEQRSPRAALAAARVPSAQAVAAAALLMTPITRFALDDTDRALAAVWPAER